MRQLLALSCAVWSLYSYAEPVRVSVNNVNSTFIFNVLDMS